MSDKDTARKQLPTKKSITRLLVVGAILLIAPLILVLSQDSICGNGTLGCLGASADRLISTIFPYPMLAGGLLIGYGMKKVADFQKEESEDEMQEADSG